MAIEVSCSLQSVDVYLKGEAIVAKLLSCVVPTEISILGCTTRDCAEIGLATIQNDKIDWISQRLNRIVVLFYLTMSNQCPYQKSNLRSTAFYQPGFRSLFLTAFLENPVGAAF